MLKAGLFIAGLTVLILLVNYLAAYRADNDLILRLCQNQAEVLANFREVLQSQQSKDPKGIKTSDIKKTRGDMIAAKLLFIVPRHSQETIDQYLLRVQQHIMGKCQQ
ncbi:MAG TPA: hypothetical protein ENI62_05215 [Gammaproteobacteria bacterium]|nr:hypothetical protein [Gammaproteobacteria bacterium]